MRINIGEKIPSSISGVSGSLLSGFVGFQALSKELGSKSLWPGSKLQDTYCPFHPIAVVRVFKSLLCSLAYSFLPPTRKGIWPTSHASP